jgi:hypothetical protein
MKFGVFSVVDHYPNTHFLAITNFGGLPHKQVMRSMELMARHVLSRF